MDNEGDTTVKHVASTTVHGSASDADDRLRSRDGKSKYVIYTQTSISITTPLIGSTISYFTYFLSVLVKLQDNKMILFANSPGPVQGRQPHVSSLQDCKMTKSEQTLNIYIPSPLEIVGDLACP